MTKTEKQTLELFRRAFNKDYGYIDIYGISDEQLASKLFEMRDIKSDVMMDRLADWLLSMGPKVKFAKLKAEGKEVKRGI